MRTAAVSGPQTIGSALALVVSVLLGVVLGLPAPTVSADRLVLARQSAASPADGPYRVNFSDDGTAPPAGWLADYGDPYGARDANLTYGWIDASTGAALDLTLTGRNRAPQPDRDIFRESLNHMDYPDPAVPAGNWEIAVPNGDYRVVVQAGDSSPEGVANTRHVVRAEGVVVLDVEKPIGAFGAHNGAGQVSVADGRLTLDSVGGMNTKLHFVVIESVGSLATPAIIGSTPTDGSRNVALDTTISANFLDLPNVDAAGLSSLDNTTITTTTVRLYQIDDAGVQQSVAASVNGTGGGDAINLTPSSPLNPESQYRFAIVGVRDLAGAELLPFSIEFKTGAAQAGPSVLDGVAFTNAGAVASGNRYTTLTIGPDGKLYGIALGGNIDRWTIGSDGSLSGRQVLTGLTDSLGARLPVGLTFAPDSTAENLVAYVTHASLVFSNGPAWDGALSRLSGADLQHERLLVTGLPRSVRDHLTNSIAFQPDNPRVLYFAQGSNSAGGAPDSAWGNREERLLSGALLRLDLDRLGSAPLDVRTSDDQAVINAALTTSPTLSDGSYNPYYVNAPLTLYATGLRNAYDMVWHTNGQLYVPTNGTAGGSMSPASVLGTRLPDGSSYAGPSIPAIGPNETQHDWLFRIDPADPHGYFGHPNPKRGEYVLNRGTPDAAAYPSSIVPGANFRGAAFDFGFNKSPNGVIEYRSNAHGGLLQGALLVARYSSGSDIIALVPDGPNGDIATAKVGIDGLGGLLDPLDLVEDPTNGNVYVSDFGAKQIVLLKPTGPGTAPTITVHNRTRLPGASGEFATPPLPADDYFSFSRIKYPTLHRQRDRQTMRISNSGNESLHIDSIVLSDPARFSLPNGEDANLPLVISAGGFADLEVAFIENVGSKGNRTASLELHSNAANDPVFTATLNGLYAVSYEGGNEPSAQDIFNAFGFTTSIGADVRPSSDYPVAADVEAGVHGDLVLSELWEAADTNAPVRVVRLASFEGPFESDAGLVEVANDNVVGGFVLSAADEWNQSILPTARADEAEIDGHAAIVAGQFRIASGGYTSSGRGPIDPATGTPPVLGVRVYQAIDRNGDVIEDAYLMLQDFVNDGCTSASGQCDWNDSVLYLTNIRPVDPIVPAIGIPAPTATPIPPPSFACWVDAGEVTWTDAGQSKYWVYRSVDGGASFSWLGRTVGATTFVDAGPVVGARYQVHYQGIPRVDCTINAEPQIATPSFACEVDAGVLSWTDAGQSKYWVYRSVDGGASFSWLGRTTGATTFVDAGPVVGAQYQVHYQGIPRVDCTINAEPTAAEAFQCAVAGGTVSWTDAAQSKYWVYRSVDGGATFTWLGRTVGATTFVDPSPTQGASYQVHYQGIPRTNCSAS